MEAWSDHTSSQERKRFVQTKLYAGKTVLPAFAKIFERIAHMQMTDHFEPIFHDFMFAYCRYHSCPTALLTLIEHWKEELDKHKVTGAVAMDLSFRLLTA